MFLTEECAELVLLYKRANMTTGLLEEDLHLPARDFSDPVNLLHELLQEGPNVPLIERGLVGANCCEQLRISLAFLDDHLHQ